MKSRPEQTPSFEDFADFVRGWAGVPKRKQITPATLFEDDLGITGDDGTDLLGETERRFGVSLSSPEHGYRVTFNLEPNEFLFHGEGFGPNWPEVLGFRASTLPPRVRSFTIGELFNAVRNAANTAPGSEG